MIYLKKISSIILIVTLTILLCSCEISTTKAGYDNREFDISVNQDGSLIAKTDKISTNSYTLTISGNGDSISYNTKEMVPWNAITKRITKVTINDGITSLGSYLFYNIDLDSIFLPSTVNLIEKDAFKENVTIYSYGKNIETTINNNIYYYSATKPANEGNYFYLLDNEPVLWKVIKFLFIGNSFTYCPQLGSVDDPYIPGLFKSIADDLGIDVEVDAVTKGSHTLTRFVNKDDEMGSIVDEKLHNNQYDFIILQEHSTTPINNYQTFYNAVSSFKNKIGELQKNADIRLYQTWGFPNSDNTRDVVEMTNQLINAYNNCGKELDIEVNEVGKGFNVITKDYPNCNLYISDNKHTSAIGAYLSALIHFGSMINIDFRSTSVRGGLDEATAKIIKDIAYNIVFKK